MPATQPDTFDAYERLVRERLQTLSARQRLAFTATLAERSLAAYEKFSSEQGWGEPEALRRITASVWSHLQGQPLAPVERVRLAEEISVNAPDTEEFDQPSAWRALQACLILSRALECCEKADSAVPATKAALAAFQAVLGDWPSDPASQRRAWKKTGAQKEWALQSALLDAVAVADQFEEAAVGRLRSAFAPDKARARGSRNAPQKTRRKVDDDSVDGWRAAVQAYLSRSPAHRIAFAAALAEQLLPHYRAFSTATGTGRPDLLETVLEAVWQSAKHPPAEPAILEAHQANLQQAAPDEGDPAARDAWSAWRVLELALASCGSVENTEPAGEAAVVAFERVAGRGARNDPKLWKEQHRRPEVHGQVMQQMMLLMRLRALQELDERSLQTLRPKG